MHFHHQSSTIISLCLNFNRRDESGDLYPHLLASIRGHLIKCLAARKAGWLELPMERRIEPRFQRALNLIPDLHPWASHADTAFGLEKEWHSAIGLRYSLRFIFVPGGFLYPILICQTLSISSRLLRLWRSPHVSSSYQRAINVIPWSHGN